MRNPLLIFLLLPAMEIGLLALFASQYGLAAVAAEVFGTSLLGIALLRRSGARSLVEMNARLQAAQESPEQVLRDLLRAVAGLLLVIPGIATDAVGLLLLVPAFRRRVARRWTVAGDVFRYDLRTGQAPPDDGSPDAFQPRQASKRPPRSGEVIDGEFTRED